jgi:multidrug efflux pump subunit AcrA (membrane-fusion protein)
MIQVKELQDVVQIPNRAVRYLGTRQFVFIAGLGQPQPVEVNLETITAEYSQLIEGDINPGDRIVLEPPEWLVAGLKP